MPDIIPRKYYDKLNGSLLTASQALTNCKIRLVPFDDSWMVSRIMVCDRPKFNGGGYGLLGEVHRSPVNDDDDIITDEDKAAYVERSQRRARKAVEDIMDCNDFQWFMTFTLDENIIDRTDYKAFIEKVRQYLDNRVRRYGWKYCAVVEYHKRTERNGKHALHLHACVSGNKFNLVDSGTVVNPKGGKPITRAYARRLGYDDSELKTVYNVTDWTLGYSTAIHTYGKRFALSRYITKYITKSDDKIGGRWYYSGGALDRPIYLCDNIVYDDFVGNVEFKHEFGEFKIRYFDEGLPIDRLESLCKFR